MKRVVVLGSTGSIGTQTLDVISQLPDSLRLVGIAAGRNAEKLCRQATEFGVSRLALFEENTQGLPSGMDAILDLVRSTEADLVVISVAGVIGLLPTLTAIDEGKDIALASKEVLVAAGEVVMPRVQKAKIQLTPIDSEHSALFQCLQGYTSDQVDSLILTASGGPFRGKKRADLRNITVEQALNHPTWRMGGKITIDSATLMNKGLETIEAKWLFGVGIRQVQTVIHPQSIVHSMVKFNDGSVLGQMGWPDMRLPIQYSLLYPQRMANSMRPWNPIDTPNLTFEEVDHETFRSIRLAQEACETGGTLPCVMNAANEEAANAFLRGEIGFLEITDVVEKTMENHAAQEATLENVVQADVTAREEARTHMQTAGGVA